jgi:hypothetical protein
MWKQRTINVTGKIKLCKEHTDTSKWGSKEIKVQNRTERIRFKFYKEGNEGKSEMK